MSDELPTEERLARIERRVQQRIDARRATAQRVARGVIGGVAAVLLVGGGFALLRPTLATPTSGSAAGSVAQGTGPATVLVMCHSGEETTRTRADRAGLPASAITACASERFSANAVPRAQGAAEPDASSPTISPSASVLCRTKDGALHVYPGGAAACSPHRMTPYPR